MTISTRPLAALGIALTIIGVLSLYTFGTQRIARHEPEPTEAHESVRVHIVVTTTGPLAADDFALERDIALRVSIDGVPLHQSRSLDAGQAIAFDYEAAANIDHRLLIEATPQNSDTQPAKATAVRVEISHGAQPVAERVVWSDHGQAIGEEIPFRIVTSVPHSHP